MLECVWTNFQINCANVGLELISAFPVTLSTNKWAQCTCLIHNLSEYINNERYTNIVHSIYDSNSTFVVFLCF